MRKKPVAERTSKKIPPKRRPARRRPTLAERVRDLERRVAELEAGGGEPSAPSAVGSLMECFGTWVGDDLPALRRENKALRSKARF